MTRSVPVLCLLVLLFTLVESQEEGRVGIGLNSTHADELYSFNVNYGQGDIPVYLYLSNATDTLEEQLEPVYYVEQVEVTCELSLSGNGYSEATFSPVTLDAPNGVLTGEVTATFDDTGVGRKTEFRCWGESVGTSNQFLKESSLSPPALFEVRPGGSVSLCDDETVSKDGLTSGKFNIDLSEEVEVYEVDITCQFTNLTESNSLELTFDPVTVAVGKSSAEVVYHFTGGSEPVEVSCTGDSQTPTRKQFDPATSEGRTATFSLHQPMLSLVPDYTTSHISAFKVFLLLDSQQEDVSVNCFVSVLDNLTDTDNIVDDESCLTASASGLSLGVTAGLVGPTSENDTELADWVVDPAEFTFTGLYHTLTVNRTATVSAPTLEILGVTCCVRASDNVRYVNETALMKAAMYLDPNRTISWQNATVEGQQTVETDIINPAWVELSPCPCDLTQNACDVDCCCDQNCTSDDLLTFTCTPGVAGGYGRDETPHHECDATFFKRPDWFPLMCVEIENTAFLGYYWFPIPILRDTNSYNSKADKFRPDFSYVTSEGSSRQADKYVDGVSVFTSDEDTPQYHDSYRLTLPQRTWSGECVWSAPVRYLVDMDDSCKRHISAFDCENNPAFNARMYAQSTSWKDDPCRGPVLLSNLLSPTPTVAETNINYLCANEEDLSLYLSSTEKLEDVMPANLALKFSYELPLDEAGEVDCAFDPNLGIYRCFNQTIGEALPGVPLPERCPFDYGHTKPPAPSYNPNTDVCENAVIDVLYNFTWLANDIVYLNGTIILGDISMQTVSGNVNFTTNVTQKFASMFVHDYTAPEVDVNATEEDNVTNVLRPAGRYQRSGNPGYEYEKAVISGISIYDNETVANTSLYVSNTSMYIDANDTSQLSLWLPGKAGLCEDASRGPIPFGQNSLSSCILRLGLTDLKNCTYLRKLVLNRQDAMMPSNYISLGGDPDRADVDNHWVPVLREDISHIIEEENATESTTAEPTTLAPLEVTGAYNVSNFTGYTYLDDLVGRCPNIPSGIHVDIMYAETGLAKNWPIYEIVGAKVRYTLSLWQLYCTGADGISCYSDSDWLQQVANGEIVQSFSISTSVQFLKVPATEPVSSSKWETEHNNDLCEHDTCWEQLFYPWMPSFKGDDHTYVLGFTLVWVVFVGGIFMVTRPWW